jgi:hypothetical protein
MDFLNDTIIDAGNDWKVGLYLLRFKRYSICHNNKTEFLRVDMIDVWKLTQLVTQFPGSFSV